MTFTRNLGLLSVPLAAALALPPAPAAAQEGLTTIDLLMPRPRTMSFYPLIVGEELGYFEEEGIEVNLLPFETTIPYVAFLQNGQADLAMLDFPQTFQAVSRDIPLRIVYEAQQLASEGVAVLEDSPLQSVSELPGKTVGLVTERDQTTLEISLNVTDTPSDEVETVVVGEAAPTIANALTTGAVDAIAGAEPDWFALQVYGIGIRRITPPEVSDTPANSFAVSEQALEEMRPELEAFFRAYSKGMAVADVVDREILEAIVKSSQPHEWEDETSAERFLDGAVRRNYSVTEQLGAVQPQIWTNIQEPMVEVGVFEETIDVSRFLDDSLIEPANDFDREEVAAEARAWAEQNM